MITVTIEYSDDDNGNELNITRSYDNLTEFSHLSDEFLDIYSSIKVLAKWDGEFKVKKVE